MGKKTDAERQAMRRWLDARLDEAQKPAGAKRVYPPDAAEAAYVEFIIEEFPYEMILYIGEVGAQRLREKGETPAPTCLGAVADMALHGAQHTRKRWSRENGKAPQRALSGTYDAERLDNATLSRFFGDFTAENLVWIAETHAQGLREAGAEPEPNCFDAMVCLAWQVSQRVVANWRDEGKLPH